MHENINALVMDDENIWRDIFKRNLEGFGIKNVDTASSMEQALNCIAKKNYHVMVLDTKGGMEISGPNVAKRAIELGQSPIIFALSGREENADLWKNLGFEYIFINKMKFEREDIYVILQQKLAGK